MYIHADQSSSKVFSITSALNVQLLVHIGKCMYPEQIYHLLIQRRVQQSEHSPKFPIHATQILVSARFVEQASEL